MPLRRGCIYWAHLDKRRPVVVISPDARNERASDVIVIPCSTVLRAGPWHVALREGEGGLGARSVAKCEQITTLPVEDLEARPLGAPLSSARVAELERAILRAIGVPIP